MSKSRLIGVVTLIAWVTSLNLLYPLPPQKIASWSLSSEKVSAAIQEEVARTGMSPADIQRVLSLKSQREAQAIWIKWVTLVVVVITGTMAAAMALRNVNGWRFTCAATSLLYLAGWVAMMSGVPAPNPQTLLDVYISSLLNHFSSGAASALVFVQRDMVAPLIHFFVATLLLYDRS